MLKFYTLVVQIFNVEFSTAHMSSSFICTQLPTVYNYLHSSHLNVSLLPTADFVKVSLSLLLYCACALCRIYFYYFATALHLKNGNEIFQTFLAISLMKRTKKKKKLTEKNPLWCICSCLWFCYLCVVLCIRVSFSHYSLAEMVIGREQKKRTLLLNAFTLIHSTNRSACKVLLHPI